MPCITRTVDVDVDIDLDDDDIAELLADTDIVLLEGNVAESIRWAMIRRDADALIDALQSIVEAQGIGRSITELLCPIQDRRAAA